MSPTRFLLLAFGCATALNSCALFKKKDPTVAEDPYAAANPYAPGATGAAPAQPGYPAYGNTGTGAYDAGNPYTQPAPGSYAPPNYNQPYTQPTGSGYAATPPPANYGAASGSGRTHKVASGENLTKIAKRYGVTVDALMRANNLQTPDLIRQGETLHIP